MGVEDAQVCTLVKWISAWTQLPDCNIRSGGSAHGWGCFAIKEKLLKTARLHQNNIPGLLVSSNAHQKMLKKSG